MATWFTADLHLGHRNIIDYAERPFADVDAMNRALMAGWNDTVDADDTVWVLGDFALGRIGETLPLIADLAGHKVLLAGNHDRCWTGHGRRAEGWARRYLDAGFEEIHQGTADLQLAGDDVLLCHFPYHGESHDLDRYLAWRPVDEGRWLLHGHVHQRWGQHGRMINVGVDTAGYRPVGEGEIAELIASGPADRPHLV